MKLKDIKVGDYVAARVKRYEHSSTSTERCRVKAIEGRDITLFVPVWQEKRRVYFTVIDATWADHEAEQDRKAAAAEAARKRQNAAWEARRAAERERFEAILPAFAGLPAPERYPEDRVSDLAEYIAEMMLDGGSTTVQFREDSLAAIAQRITELSNVVAQSALTAQDLPEAGWGYTPGTPEEDAELEQELRRDGGAEQPERTIIEIPLADLGLLVPDGDA